MQIIISDSYLESFMALDKQSQRIVKNSLKKLAKQPKGAGFKIHNLDRVRCDSSFKSARINDDLRLILAQQEDKYVLMYVDHHDKAYSWASGKFLNISTYGALYLYNEKMQAKYTQQEQLPFIDKQQLNQQSLLSKQEITQKDLTKLGIDEEQAEELIKITSEDSLLEALMNYPQELQEAILDIAAGQKTITQVYPDLIDDNSSGTTQLERALEHKNSKRRFYVVEDIEHLESILNEDMEKWKIFLHPRQEFLVTSNFNGPVLVEGGPGTGKSVVGIHRATFLAKSICSKKKDGKILFCTFSRKLVTYVKEKMERLVEQNNITNNVAVMGVDQLIYHLVKEYELTDSTLNAVEVNNLLIQTYQDLNPPHPLYLYQVEYKEVVQKYNIYTLKQYLKVNRSGMGKALNPSERRKVWEFFEEFLNRKKVNLLMDHDDWAYLVYEAVSEGKIKPIYDSIIVDEAQDLSSVKIKAVTSLAKSQPNNIMLLSDQNQRIFRLNNWRKDVKLDIVGRTFYLFLNYRTTKQIREYADWQFVNSEMTNDHIREYKSLLMGTEPIVKGFDTPKAQYNFLIQKIKGLLENGYKSHEICVIVPAKTHRIAGIFEYKGVYFTILDRETCPCEGCGVCITTLHGCKGLEFRAVCIINYQDITKELTENKVNEDWYLTVKLKQLECLKYVAATRAREELLITYVN